MSDRDNYKVDIDIVKYYQSSLKSYQNASDNDKYDEALKTVASLNKNGIKVCYHKSICKIMEQFLKDFPTGEIVGCLFRSINAYLDGVIIGKNTSRLLEKVLLACQSKDIAQDDIVQFQSEKFCEYMWIHYPDNLENNIGSHIVRMFFQFFCGVYVGMEGMVYSSKSIIISKPMQSNYKEKLEDLIKRFLMNPQINLLITNEYMSSTLQIILVICSVRCPEKYDEVVKHLMSILCCIEDKVSSKNSDLIKIPESFRDKYQSFFLECLIYNIEDGIHWKRFVKKYLNLGKEKFITDIFENSNSCGLFRSAIMRLNSTKLLLEIIQQIKSNLLEIKNFQCGNVFLKLIIEFVNKIVLFTEEEQSELRSYKNSIIEIVQFLSKDDSGSNSLVKFLGNGLKFQNTEEDREELDEENFVEHEKVCSVWSSLLMQAILKRFKPIPKSINNLFIGTKSEEIVQLCSNSKASRLIETFIDSGNNNVPDNVKIRFFDLLSAEELFEIACSKFGSRVMDCIYLCCQNNQLFTIIKSKLESKRNEMKQHNIGKYVESKFFGYIPKQKGKIMKKSKDNETKKVVTQKRSAQVNDVKNGSHSKKQKIK